MGRMTDATTNTLAERTVRDIGFDKTTATRAQALAALTEQLMASYSVSDDEGPLTGAVERFLRDQPHLTVRRHGDTIVASTDFGRERRVILAGHLDVVPVIYQRYPLASLVYAFLPPCPCITPPYPLY